MKLAKMRVVEMRKELEHRGLDSSGTRPTLMKRLREALNREESKEPAEHYSGQPEAGHKGTEEKRHPEDSASPGSRPKPVKAASDITQRDQQPPAASRSTPPSTTAPEARAATQSDDRSKSFATGSIELSGEVSLDERMQKRRERFGSTSNAPLATEDAIQRRRKRFGIVEKNSEEQPAKRRRPSKEVDEQVLKEHEEAKKRRAIKFGIFLDSGNGPSTESALTADEMEKRLKRQRRFQQVGS